MPESALQKIVYFNPRSLVGNDCAGCNHCNHFFISIHVPSWGTTINVRAVVHHDVFQSTFPRGERPLSGSASLRSVYFNPRSLVGNDREPFFEGVLLHYFNPRSLVGNDDIYKGLHPLVRISIHVPSWGTTECILMDATTNQISIHVPSWGTTANFHKYSLFFYAINIIFLLFIIPSLFSLVLFMLLF